MWSIYKKSQTLIEDSEAHVLAQEFPYAACHDGTNVVFVKTLPDAIDPFILPSELPNGDPLSNDDQAVIAAKWLFLQSDKAMYLAKAQAEMLFTHPAHRLWCAKYEADNREQFESDYNYVGEFLRSVNSAVPWPEFSNELTPEGARALMLQGLAQA